MRIAILGASSQIARDLIIALSTVPDVGLHLFARRPDHVTRWLVASGLPNRFAVDDFLKFSTHEFDAIINFVGAGDPAQAVAMGRDIFDVTLQFDAIALAYLKNHPDCRYIFLSSGAAYGSVFHEPASHDTQAIVPINNLPPSEWYGAAKRHAECLHRAHPELSIIDIRVFNYFSASQDINSRYFISDILRAIRHNAILKTNSNNFVRDYLHPSDFFQLINALLLTSATNDSVDCYSLAPIDKINLLETMGQEFGLRYEFTDSVDHINATGNKLNYYSVNHHASDFGYKPSVTSIDGIIKETQIFLARK